eukprot:11171588-Lingulodinium_polyedra.AAC.1
MASAAVDRWRVVCRHLDNRKKESIEGPELQHLLEVIQFPPKGTPSPTGGEHGPRGCPGVLPCH